MNKKTLTLVWRNKEEPNKKRQQVLQTESLPDHHISDSSHPYHIILLKLRKKT